MSKIVFYKASVPIICANIAPPKFFIPSLKLIYWVNLKTDTGYMWDYKNNSWFEFKGLDRLKLDHIITIGRIMGYR